MVKIKSSCNFGSDYCIKVEGGVVKIVDRWSAEVLYSLIYELRQDISCLSVTNLDNKHFVVCYTFLSSEFWTIATLEVDSGLAITAINYLEIEKDFKYSSIRSIDKNTVSICYGDEIKYFSINEEKTKVIKLKE